MSCHIAERYRRDSKTDAGTANFFDCGGRLPGMELQLSLQAGGKKQPWGDLLNSGELIEGPLLFVTQRWCAQEHAVRLSEGQQRRHMDESTQLRQFLKG